MGEANVTGFRHTLSPMLFPGQPSSSVGPRQLPRHVTEQGQRTETAGMVGHLRPGDSRPHGLDGPGSSSQIGDCLSVGSAAGVHSTGRFASLNSFQ